MLLAREHVIMYDQEIKAAGKQYKRIMILQPDILFDEAGKAYMVECNTNGYMIGALHKGGAKSSIVALCPCFPAVMC